MKNRYNVLSVAAIYGILITLTLAVYYLSGLKNSDIYTMALGFVLLAEVASGLSMITLINRRKSTMQVLNLSSAMTTSSIYIAVSIISAMFSGYFEDHTNLYILLQVFIIALTLMIGILLATMSQRLDEVNKEENRLQSVIMDYELKLYHLTLQANGTPYESKINQLYENLKYSDRSGLSSVDTELFQSIEALEVALQNTEELSVLELIKKSSEYLNLRKQEILQSKRGGN